MAAAPVTVLDVFVKQLEMNAQLAAIHEQLKDIPDHEKRIRVLESVRAKLVGACLVLSVMAGGGAGWVALLLSRR